jgi:chitinase
VRSAARSAMLAMAASAVVLAGAVSFGQSARASEPSYPAHLAAPYLQISTSDSSDMANDMAATGLRYYTLAFLTSKKGCTLNWEADDTAAVGAFKPEVSALQKNGGNVIISFGGAISTELAETCKSVPNLEAAYAAVLKDYPGVTRLDFDIEAPAISNGAANSRRNQALAKLEKSNPSISIDYTLAVDPSGLPASPELGIIKQAKADGLKINEVNIMTQYFGNGDDLAPAESAAIGTEKQLAAIYTGLSPSRVWDMIGMTPMAAASYNNGESFTTSDASSLESWASRKGVQELAFWEVAQYDAPTGYRYSKIFNRITS